MPFSFNPGQDQSGQAPLQAPAPVTNNGVPALNVPVAPTISLTPVAEVVSPFAYKNRSKSKFGVYLQSAIFVVTAISVVFSVGLVVYQGVLKAQISSRVADLAVAEKELPKLPLEDMRKLSTRIALINKIVNERASVRTALTVIEESADNAVTFNKFTLSKSKKNNYYDLSVAGETNSYISLYQQLDILKGKTFAKAIPKIIIGGIGPIDKKGIASFKVDAALAIAGEDPDKFTVTNYGGVQIGTSTEINTSVATSTATTSDVSLPLNIIQ